MPTDLKRYQQANHLHFLTFSCYRRLPYLREPDACAVFESVLERVRTRHQFRIVGYVLMPEHVHLLMSEPELESLAQTVKVLKQETSKRLKGERKQFWHTRYYDFNVFTDEKEIEKLRYIHRNPVTRGLVAEPGDWPWSSFRHYLTGIPGKVEIDSWWTEQIRKRVRGLTPEAEAPEV